MPTGLIDKAEGEARVLRRPPTPPVEDANNDRFGGEPVMNFKVIAGLHQGAGLVLDEADYTVGSGTSADIVLRDAGIAPIHARLRCRGRRVEIEALGGTVELSKGQVVPEGQGRRCGLPLEIGVGEARFHLEARRRSPLASRVGERSWIGRLLFAGAVLVVIMAGASLALYGLPSATAFSAQARRTDDPKPVPVALEQPGAKPAAAAMSGAGNVASDARQALAARLSAAGLPGLTIATERDRLIVSGALSAQHGEAWRDIQAWFDQAYGDRVPLVSRVEAGKPASSPPLTLRAIWFGERPYVIAGDGARYHEGAFVSGGWIIEKIGEDDLRLAKNGSTVTLKYR